MQSAHNSKSYLPVPEFGDQCSFKQVRLTQSTLIAFFCVCVYDQLTLMFISRETTMCLIEQRSGRQNSTRNATTAAITIAV